MMAGGPHYATYRGFVLLPATSNGTYVDIVSDEGPINRRPVPAHAAMEYIDRRVSTSTRSAVGELISRMAWES